MAYMKKFANSVRRHCADGYRCVDVLYNVVRMHMWPHRGAGGKGVWVPNEHSVDAVRLPSHARELVGKTGARLGGNE